MVRWVGRRGNCSANGIRDARSTNGARSKKRPAEKATDKDRCSIPRRRRSREKASDAQTARSMRDGTEICAAPGHREPLWGAALLSAGKPVVHVEHPKERSKRSPTMPPPRGDDPDQCLVLSGSTEETAGSVACVFGGGARRTDMGFKK